MLNHILSQFMGRDASLYSVSVINAGLINDSYLIAGPLPERAPRFVLQRVNSIFSPEVNDDIAELVLELRRAELPVAELQTTLDGKNYFEESTGELAGVWRLWTHLKGRCLHSIENLKQLRSAAKHLALFHDALRGSKHVFRFKRGNVHDFARHQRKLLEALNSYKNHRLYGEVFEFYSTWSRLCERQTLALEERGLPLRIIHGDPKVSNFLFNADDEISGIIDLDTMARSTLACEIGDALRSWANCSDENSAPMLSSERYTCALDTYFEHAPWLSSAERSAFLRAPMRIAAELAARFAADALCETYFRHDPSIAPTHGEHALLRAKNQLQLALQFERLLA
ncbi:MAG: phosphotransferase [Bradymonadales bacterium]|jgi:Ser/Thr protein kinase RdoA (MazF antagonist)